MDSSKIKVTLFRPSGKYYTEYDVDMKGLFEHPDMKDALIIAYRREHTFMDGWLYLFMEPHHKNTHPMIIIGNDSYNGAQWDG